MSRATAIKKNDNDESSAITGRMLNRGFLMIISAALRLILIAYGEWQDAHMEVHYTDVDYLVFSDAATLMAAGKSPYDRATYRYSPFLAVLLIPNAVLHPSWGKILFSAADLLVGHLIYHVLKLRGVPQKHTILCVAAWLFNPFTFTIGTRGNCEPIVCAIILWIVLCLMKGQIMQAALWYGLVVHFRIYPIIYSLTILIILDGHYNSLNQWGQKNKPPSPDGSSVYQKFKDTVKLELSFNFLNRERILFGLLSGGVFIILTSICYYFYGQIFLHEALLYHLTRTDPRHNFSIYFYYIYLHHDRDFSLLERLFAFLPQFMVQLVLILFFAKDFSFCIFAQTVAFVAFNKVITAQYFVWFFCLLPLILPWTRLHLKWKGLLCIVAWVAAQVHWLGWAYLLEFKGLNVLVPLWLASIIFLIANVFVLVVLIANHNMLPFFKVEQNASVTVAKKSD